MGKVSHLLVKIFGNAQTVAMSLLKSHNLLLFQCDFIKVMLRNAELNTYHQRIFINATQSTNVVSFNFANGIVNKVLRLC